MLKNSLLLRKLSLNELDIVLYGCISCVLFFVYCKIFLSFVFMLFILDVLYECLKLNIVN